MKELETYLNRSQQNGQKYVRHDIAAREVDIPERHVLSAFSLLCDEDILQAKLKVRCPGCSASHGGVFERQSDVPEEQKRCFCGEDFQMHNRSNWEVVYELPQSDIDFFLKFDDSLKTFSDEAYDVSREYISNKFNRLVEMDRPAYRGQLFDHFIAILFLQIDGVHAIPRYPHSEKGEIDVLMNLSNAPDWMFRSLGLASLVENKWEKTAAAQPDYNAFESKVTEIDSKHEVRKALFISMSGFKSSLDNNLGSGPSPIIIGLSKEHVEEMVSDGTAENVVRSETFP